MSSRQTFYICISKIIAQQIFIDIENIVTILEKQKRFFISGIIPDISYRQISWEEMVMVKSKLVDIPVSYPPYTKFREEVFRFLMR